MGNIILQKYNKEMELSMKTPLYDNLDVFKSVVPNQCGGIRSLKESEDKSCVSAETKKT